MQRQVSYNKEALLKSLILLGFSVFLFWLVKSNNIIYYINPRFAGLTKLAAVLIFLMFLVQAGNFYLQTHSDHRHAHAGRGRSKLVFLPFVITLLMAFLLPNQALDAGMAQNKGMDLGSRTAVSVQSGQAGANPGNATSAETNNSDANSRGYTEQDQNPVQTKIDELRQASLIQVSEENFTLVNSEVYTYPDKYAGKEITMLGFVVKDQKFQAEQFGLVRYVITCCSADALPAGFLCEYTSAPDFNEGDWLNIRGTIELGKYEGETAPVIKVASISAAQQPENPYIYPVYF
ncbi:putative membrane protein [Desulfotomaculum arcticum]|uniref:Putative membrane protein n=1 Tax=Desulfotruncus arcticus DSM 17038 TaxID=1121424 RepID=A0A1I2PG45_9FIRM|nr:TIGR03943 family protein [Desulfotruncus arcticus]SFG14510.1 putative membrane protein [Desulfotomaculum arcticum] [Desulfotruncus arcticus DSM 17038]